MSEWAAATDTAPAIPVEELLEGLTLPLTTHPIFSTAVGDSMENRHHDNSKKKKEASSVLPTEPMAPALPSLGEEELENDIRFSIEKETGFADDELEESVVTFSSSGSRKSILPSSSSPPRATLSAFFSIQGRPYVDEKIIEAMKAATLQRGYRCPVWASYSSIHRAGLSLKHAEATNEEASPPLPMAVKVTLSAGQKLFLYNLEEAEEYTAATGSIASDLAAGLSSGEYRHSASLHVGQTIIRAVRRYVDQSEDRWAAVPRDLLGRRLNAFWEGQIRSQHPDYGALQAQSPLWLTESTRRSLSIPLASSEGKEEGEEAGKSLLGVPRGQERWHHLSQLDLTNCPYSFEQASLQANPLICLNMKGKEYHLPTSFLLREYCHRFGYSKSTPLCVFVTPKRLAEYGGYALGHLEDPCSPPPPPFSFAVKDEVVSLLCTEQTNLHEHLRKEALRCREDNMSSSSRRKPFIESIESL